MSWKSVFLFVVLSASGAAQRPVVLLDGYHNHEPQPHYRWEGTYGGGYSRFGELLQSMGAEIRTTEVRLSTATLAGSQCLIIVDPDTPEETPKPNYIEKDEIAAVREWVRSGGVLFLLGNDPGNAEFVHFNELAREFGIQFIEKKHLNAAGTGKLTIPTPDGVFYVVDVAPLEVTAPRSKKLITDGDEVIMAEVEFGRGRVVALGDPWVYNEYIGTRDNRAVAAKLFARVLGLRAAAATGVKLERSEKSLAVTWPDETGRDWRAEFALDPKAPLITSIAVGGKRVVERANPVYRCNTGIRRGGWDEFFDLPPSHPQGTRAFWGVFQQTGVRTRTVGNRLEVEFDGFAMGIFKGSIRYTFYPGSRLVQQEAVVKTSEPDVAFYYDAGLKMAAGETQLSYFDTTGTSRTLTAEGPQWNPLRVRYRTLAAQMKEGSIAAFPAPHQYFFPRDLTTNMGYLWESEWHGTFAFGIRQLPDDNRPYYPWMNAPPGTEQKLGIFFLVSDGAPAKALEDVLRFTNRDRFPILNGYKTVAAHWHFGYSVQAAKNGFDWVPPFKPVLKDMGVDAVVLADFHGDGHPKDPGALRLQELDNYFKACKAQSDTKFLLIPSEEANVHLGGHWDVIFPKPVYWIMSRAEGQSVRTEDAEYGTVYRARDPRDLLEIFRRENALVYTSHPRSKGSKGYPDNYKDTEFYRDAHFFGGSWKSINIDPSSPRMGERSLKLLDDMNNWGQRKRILTEVDVFEIDATHELYGHMNVNYVRMNKLPDFEHYGEVVNRMAAGDFFMSTGEVTLPELTMTPLAGGKIAVKAKVRWTFPLRFAEVVWDGGAKVFALDTTQPFGERTFEWTVDAGAWKWARFAVWDVAANGAFVNPIWRAGR